MRAYRWLGMGATHLFQFLSKFIDETVNRCSSDLPRGGRIGYKKAAVEQASGYNKRPSITRAYGLGVG